MPGRKLRTERVVLSEKLVVDDPRAIDFDERALKFKQSVNFAIRTSALNPDVAVKAAIATPSADPNDTDGRKREFTADSRPGMETDSRGNRWMAEKTYEPGDKLVLFPSFSSKTSISTEPNFGWMPEKDNSFSSFEEMIEFIKKKPQVKLTKYKVNPKTGDADESSGVEIDPFSIPSGLSIEERRRLRANNGMQREEKMLGRSLRDRIPGGTLVARIAAVAGVLIDERNRFRCPPGTPAASQYTDRMGSNCFGFSASRFARYAQRQARELYPEGSKVRNTVRDLVKYFYTGETKWWGTPEVWGRTPLYDATTGEPIPHPDWRDVDVPPEQRWLRGAMSSAQDKLAQSRADVLGLQTMLGVDTSEEARADNSDVWATFDALRAAGLWDIQFEFDNGIGARPNKYQVERIIMARLQAIPNWQFLTDDERRALIKADTHRYYVTERAYLEAQLKKFIDQPELAREIALIQYKATGEEEASTGFFTDASGRLRAFMTLDINKIMNNQEAMLPNLGPNERLAIAAVGATSEAEGMSAVSDFLHSSTAAARQMSGMIEGAYTFAQHIGYHEHGHVATAYAVLQKAQEELARTGRLEVPQYRNGKFTGMKVVTAINQLTGNDLMTLMKGGAREVDPKAIEGVLERTGVAAFLAGSYPNDYRQNDAVYFLEVVAELAALRDMGLLTGEELDAANKALEWMDSRVGRLVEDRRMAVEAEEAARVEAESYDPDIDVDPATVTPEELDEIHRRELAAETATLRAASKAFESELLSAVERGDSRAVIEMSADPALGVYTLVPLMNDVAQEIDELTDGGKIKEEDMSPENLKALKVLQQKEKLLLLQHNVYKESVRKARHQYSKNFTPAGGQSGRLIFDANVRDELLRTRGLDIEEIKKKVKEGVPIDSVLDLDAVKEEMRSKHGDKTPKKLVSLITDKTKQRALIAEKDSDEYLQLSTEINELSEMYVKKVKLDGDKRSLKAIREELDLLVESGTRPKPRKARKFKSVADSNEFASSARKATGRRLTKKERDAVKEIGDFRDAEVTQLLNPEEQVAAGRSINRKNARLKKMGLTADPSSKDEGSMEEQVENILIPAMEAIDKTSNSEPFEIEAVVDLDSAVTTGKIAGREVDLSGFTRGRTMPRGKSTIEGLPKPKKGMKNKTRVIVSVKEGDRGLFTYKEKGDTADLFVMPPGRIRIIGKDDDGTLRVEFVQQKDTTEVLGSLASSIGEGTDDAAWRSGAKKKISRIFDSYVSSRGTSGTDRAGTRSTDADEVKDTSKRAVASVSSAGGSFGSAPDEAPGIPAGTTPPSATTRADRRRLEKNSLGQTYEEYLDSEYKKYVDSIPAEDKATALSREDWLNKVATYRYDPYADSWRGRPDLPVTRRELLDEAWDFDQAKVRKLAEAGGGAPETETAPPPAPTRSSILPPAPPPPGSAGGASDRLASGGLPEAMTAAKIQENRKLVSARLKESVEIKEAELSRSKTRVDNLKAALKEFDETGVWQGEKYGVSSELPTTIRGDIEQSLDARSEFTTTRFDEYEPFREDILKDKPDATPEEIAKIVEDKKKAFREEVIRKIDIAEKEIKLQEYITESARARREQGILDVEDIPEDIIDQLRTESAAINSRLSRGSTGRRNTEVYEQPSQDGMIGVIHNGAGHLDGGILNPQKTVGDETINSSAGSNVRHINLRSAELIIDSINYERATFELDRGLYDMVNSGLDEIELTDQKVTGVLKYAGLDEKATTDLVEEVRRVNKLKRADGSLPDGVTWPKVKKSSFDPEKLRKAVEKITPESLGEQERQVEKLKKFVENLRKEGGQHLSAYVDPVAAIGGLNYNARLPKGFFPSDVAELPDAFLVESGRGDGEPVIKDEHMYPRWAALAPRTTSYYVVGEEDVDIAAGARGQGGESQIASRLKPQFGLSVPTYAGFMGSNPAKTNVPKEVVNLHAQIAPAIFARAMRQYNRDGKIDVETVLSDPSLAPDFSERLSSGSERLSSGSRSAATAASNTREILDRAAGMGIDIGKRTGQTSEIAQDIRPYRESIDGFKADLPLSDAAKNAINNLVSRGKSDLEIMYMLAGNGLDPAGLGKVVASPDAFSTRLAVAREIASVRGDSETVRKIDEFVAEVRNMSPEELRDAVNSHIASNDGLLDRRTVVLARDPASILDTGRYETIHDGRQSMGGTAFMQAPDIRKAAEKHWLNIDKNAPNDIRPASGMAMPSGVGQSRVKKLKSIYGDDVEIQHPYAIGRDADELYNSGGAGLRRNNFLGYGSNKIILRPETSERTLVTRGDSIAGVTSDMPSIKLSDVAGNTDSSAFFDPLSVLFDARVGDRSSIASTSFNGLGNFAEALVLGSFEPSDIQAIVVDAGNMRTSRSGMPIPQGQLSGINPGASYTSLINFAREKERLKDQYDIDLVLQDSPYFDVNEVEPFNPSMTRKWVESKINSGAWTGVSAGDVIASDATTPYEALLRYQKSRVLAGAKPPIFDHPDLTGDPQKEKDVFVGMIDEELERLAEISITNRSRRTIEEMRDIVEEKSVSNQWIVTKTLFGVESKSAVKIPTVKPQSKKETKEPDTRETRRKSRRKLINGVVKELKRIAGGAVSKEYPGLTRADIDPRLMKMIINEPVEVITARLERNAMKMHLGFDRRIRIRLSEDELNKFAKSGVLRFAGIPDEERQSRRLQRISSMDPAQREARLQGQPLAETEIAGAGSDQTLEQAFNLVDMIKSTKRSIDRMSQSDLDAQFNNELKIIESPETEDSDVLFETKSKALAVALLMLGHRVQLAPSGTSGSLIPEELTEQAQNGAIDRIKNESPEWLRFSSENKPAGLSELVLPDIKQSFVDQYEIDFCSMPQASTNILCATGITIDREDMPQLVGNPSDEASFAAKIAKSGQAGVVWKSVFADELDEVNEQIDEAIDALEMADTKQNQLVVSALREQKSSLQEKELRYRKLAARHIAPRTKMTSAINAETASLTDAIEQMRDQLLRMEEIGVAQDSETMRLKDKVTAMSERLDVLNSIKQGKPLDEDLDWFYKNTDWSATLVDLQPMFVKYVEKITGNKATDSYVADPLQLAPSQQSVKAATVNTYAQQIFDEAEMIADVLKNRGIYPGTDSYDQEFAAALSDNPIGSPIVVTNENQIIDGHHKWAATIIANQSMPDNERIPVNIIKVNTNVVEALSLAKVFQEAAGLSSVRKTRKKRSSWKPSEIEAVDDDSVDLFIEKTAGEARKKVSDLYDSGHFIKIVGVGLPSRNSSVKRDPVSLMKASLGAYRETPINRTLSKKTVLAGDRREENGRKINKLRSMEAAIDGALKRSNIPQKHASDIKQAVFAVMTLEKMPKIGVLSETAYRIARESGFDLARLMLNELVSRKKITKKDRSTVTEMLKRRDVSNLAYEMQGRISNAFKSAIQAMKDGSAQAQRAEESSPLLTLSGTRRIVGERSSSSIYGTKKDEDDEYASGNNVNQSLNKMLREHFEKIGIPRTVGDEDLPITGYVIHKSHIKKKFTEVMKKGVGSVAETAVFEIADSDPAGDGIPAYGEIELVMKPGVSSRAAYSLGHSLSTGRIPVLLNSTEKDDIADAFIAGKSQKAKWANLESIIGLLMVDVTNDFTNVNVGNVSVKQGPNKMFETLVLGGVDKDEVMQVNYPYSKIEEMAHSQNPENVINMEAVKKKLLLSQMNPAEIDRILGMPSVLEKAPAMKQIREYMAADAIRKRLNQFGFDKVKIAHPDGFDLFDPRSYQRGARPSDTVISVLQAKFTEEVFSLAQKESKESNRTGAPGILRK